jgi:hypothetical protein
MDNKLKQESAQAERADSEVQVVSGFRAQYRMEEVGHSDTKQTVTHNPTRMVRSKLRMETRIENIWFGTLRQLRLSGPPGSVSCALGQIKPPVRRMRRRGVDIPVEPSINDRHERRVHTCISISPASALIL